MPVGIGLGAGAVVGGISARNSAKSAASASDRAANVAAESQREGLDVQREGLDFMREQMEWQKEVDALPRELREKALRGLDSFYQVPGAMRSQDELINEARSSPLYNAIMGHKQGAVDEMARYASATGGLRSGGAQAAFARQSVELENEALLRAFQQAQQRDDYNRGMHLTGLTGLAGLQGNDGAIAGLTGQIGQQMNLIGQQMGKIEQTKAMGILGGAQDRQQGNQNMMNNVMGFAGLGLNAYNAGLIHN